MILELIAMWMSLGCIGLLIITLRVDIEELDSNELLQVILWGPVSLIAILLAAIRSVYYKRGSNEDRR
jgi:hypothetical protein